jgi:hypothetical protein
VDSRTLSSILDRQKMLFATVVDTNDHQDTQLFPVGPQAAVDAVRPQVDLAVFLQSALAPALIQPAIAA